MLAIHSLFFLLPNLSFLLTSWSGVSCCSPGPQLTSYFLQHLFLFGSLRAWRRATAAISAPVPPLSASILTFAFPRLNAAELQDDCRDGSATITVLVKLKAGSNVSVLHLQLISLFEDLLNLNTCLDAPSAP